MTWHVIENGTEDSKAPTEMNVMATEEILTVPSKRAVALAV